MLSFRHHGSGVGEVWLTGHLLEEEQELYKHPVEAWSGEAAGLGHELPGTNPCIFRIYALTRYLQSVMSFCGAHSCVFMTTLEADTCNWVRKL